MIAAQSVVPKQKLKIKFPSQRIEAIPAPQSLEFEQQLCSTFDGKKASSALISKETSGAYKRGPEGLIVGGPQEKRRKMDRNTTQQCSTLLKALMKHPAGWIFNQPVDPKALNIPDYFTIIKNPMDLGTIKSKLVKNTYLGIQEFVADIKLTFSNAMLYNPPSNNVHKMAEEMNEFFEVRWKSLEEKWNQENFDVGHGKILSVQLKDVNEARQSCPRTQLSRHSSLPKKSKPSEEKVVGVPLNARPVEVELPKPAQNCVIKLAGKNLKGSSSGSGGCAHGSINAKPPLSPGACNCSSYGSIKCHCILPSYSNHASSSDVTSERSLVGDLRECSADATKLDCQAKSTLTSQMRKSDPYSDGAVSALYDENVCPSSLLPSHTARDASDEGLSTPIFDTQMSPKKALRAAILKSRFADTILKAQQKTLLDHGDKADPVKIQQEKEKLERRQREEKAKIEAQIRAAKAAAKLKTQVELKKQLEREREAARIALQKMEKTAEIELNVEIQRELEILSGCSLFSNQLHGRKSGSEKVTGAYGGTRDNPLHQLGLFIKDEYLEDDDDETVPNEDGEEGEILSET